jgi:hypothetical protein
MSRETPLSEEIQQQLRDISAAWWRRLPEYIRCEINAVRGEDLAEAAFRLGQQTADVEPMNLRIFYDPETRGFFLRGCGGSGVGPTPEDAMHQLVMSRNTFEADQWPLPSPPQEGR